MGPAVPAMARELGCLLTGVELFPGNIQGGSHTPAGWASGISIDQEIKNFLQSRPESRTRFGSLEFGVTVPGRADPWTRMVYTGPNKPLAPIDNPYQMLAKMYGQVQDRESLTSILDDVQDDLRKVRAAVGKADHPVAAGGKFGRVGHEDKGRAMPVPKAEEHVHDRRFVPGNHGSDGGLHAAVLCNARKTIFSMNWA